MSARRPAVNAQLRRRLVQTASVGGARPKATLRDDELALGFARFAVPWKCGAILR